MIAYLQALGRSGAGNAAPVTWFIFVGDMLVMAFMIALVVWVSMRSTRERLDGAARIPLEDEESRG